MKFILPATPLEFPFVKAWATFAIINEIEGRIMPAKMAEKVPITKRVFSKVPMYRKKVKKPMLCGSSALSISIGIELSVS